MKYIFKILFVVMVASLLGILSGHGVFADFIGASGKPDIPYDSGDLGLDKGVKYVKDGIDGIQTDESFSDYIQNVVIYLLTFISILAVIYVMWAGLQILTGNGDDEKLVKARKTIVYVLIGIVVIWLAWPITKWMLDLFSQ